MGQIERISAALSVLLVFVYVVLRAIYVPTFHDEAATFFHYIVSEKFLPYQAHWDANNHLLNSALGYLCYKILGPQQWWVRLPNVLSFLVFGYYSIQISAQIRQRLVRWMLLIGLLTAAFPLEFFGLARGYAMSIAFLMGAIFHGAQFLQTGEWKHQLRLWFWMWLAVAASLTLLNSYMILLGVAFLFIVSGERYTWQNLLVWLLIGVSVFAAAAYYAFELKERGLLYTGLADGFIEVTVRSLVRYQLDQESAPIANFVTIVGGLSALYIVGRFLLASFKWNPIRLAASLLLLNAMASIALNLVFGMNFPENRVGMYYIPLFLITVAGALDTLSVTKKQMKWLSLGFLIFPLHLGKHFNFESTILWPRWHASDKIYDKLVDLQRERNETLMVSGEYLNELGWAYYNFLNGSEMQLLQRDPVPDTLADFIIARPEDFDFTAIPYDTAFHDEANNVFLLERTNQLRWSNPVSPKPQRTAFSGQDEFYEILNDSVSQISGHQGVLEMKGVLRTGPKPFDGQLIITSSSPTGGTYNMVPLHWIRPRWNGDTLHIKRTYHFDNNASNLKIYFWNLNKEEIAFELIALDFRSPM